MGRHLDEPFHIDSRGHAATTDADDHARDLIRAVLFTEPGERVNRPEFGCALKTLLWMPNHEVLGAATKTLVHGALQRELGLLIAVEDVAVEPVESELRVTVVYRRRIGGTRQVATFVSSVGRTG
jgi:phage baseplate assembly protein W